MKVIKATWAFALPTILVRSLPDKREDIKYNSLVFKDG